MQILRFWLNIFFTVLLRRNMPIRCLRSKKLWSSPKTWRTHQPAREWLMFHASLFHTFPRCPAPRNRSVLFLETRDFLRKVDLLVFFLLKYYQYSGYHASWSLCSEKKAEDKLEGLLFMPQEWHKKRVSFDNILNKPICNSVQLDTLI